jgi:phosphatidate cytidylyltransferase
VSNATASPTRPDTPPSPGAPPLPGSLAKRSIVGGLIAAGFMALLWADCTGFLGAKPGHWLVLVSIMFTAGGSIEIVRMAATRGLFLRPWLVPVACAFLAAVPLAVHDLAGPKGGSADPLALAVAMVFGIMGLVELVTYRRDAAALPRLAAGFATATAIGLPFAFMMRLRLVHDTPGLASLVPLASMLAVVKVGDIAAYLVGSRFGRNRMAPVLSPGKTWEGAAASLAANVAVAWLFLNVFHAGSPGPWGGWPVYGLAVGIAGMLGDLSESFVKRELVAKDSGTSLGALGGFLDLADATLLAAPVAWALWILGSLAASMPVAPP